MCEHFVVPSIRSRDVACAEWPYIRRFEHLLKLLDVVNDAFNVHASQSSKRRRDVNFGAVKSPPSRAPAHITVPTRCGVKQKLVLRHNRPAFSWKAFTHSSIMVSSRQIRPRAIARWLCQ
jgi:hypothetical protein